MTDPRIYITAYDCISPVGYGVSAQLNALFAERTALSFRDGLAEGRIPEDLRADMESLKAEKDLRQQDPLLHVSLLLMRKMNRKPKRDWGVIMGSSRGPTHTLEASWNEFIEGLSLRPHVSPASTASSLSAGVARAFQLSGPNLSLSAACATGLHAVIQASGSIIMGLSRGMLVGAAEFANSPFTFAMLRAAKVLTPSLESFPCRPGADNRQGMVLSEGAVALHLECEPDEAPLAEIVGWGASTESSTLTGVSENGEGLEIAVRGALKRAGLDASSIDLIVGHGAGTKKGDKAELSLYSRLFPEQPAFVWHKWCTGHMLGASAAYSLILAIEHLKSGRIPPHPYLEEAHPIRQSRLLSRNRYALIWSMGFGGNACAVIVKNPL